MKILLISKKTNQEILEQQIKALNIIDRTFLDNLHQSHKEHFESLNLLRKILLLEKIECFELERGKPWPNINDIDLVITLGGDGTILSSSHHLVDEKIPILGIRSSKASIGHLCALDYKNIANLPKLVKGLESETIKLERIYSEVTFQKNNQTIKTQAVLNDFLFANINPASTTRYSLSFNGHEEFHKSSGIWISTPTGSTAAIGTMSGHKQNLSDLVFQYKVRELYPHPSKFKLVGSLFNPDQEELFITSYNNKAILAIDGQHGSIDLTLGDKITFKRAKALRIVKPLIS